MSQSILIDCVYDIVIIILSDFIIAIFKKPWMSWRRYREAKRAAERRKKVFLAVGITMITAFSIYYIAKKG